MVSVSALVGYETDKHKNVSVKHNYLKLEPLYSPEQAVWFALIVKPPLQLSHMAAPCLVHARRVLGEPFGQLHMLADTHTHALMRVEVTARAMVRGEA